MKNNLVTKESRQAVLKFLNEFEKEKKKLIKYIIDSGEDENIIVLLSPAFEGLTKYINEIANIYNLKFKKTII